jgi:hypothetical protein
MCTDHRSKDCSCSTSAARKRVAGQPAQIGAALLIGMVRNDLNEAALAMGYKEPVAVETGHKRS